jgi:subfamily B ATP-binding cassette protein MsbA
MSFMVAMLLLSAPLKRLSVVMRTPAARPGRGRGVFALLDRDVERDTGTLEIERARGAIASKASAWSTPARPHRR